MDLLQDIYDTSSNTTDSLVCLEELDMEEEILAESIANEVVIPFEQAVDHNMNAQYYKSQLSARVAHPSSLLRQADFIAPRCQTPPATDHPELGDSMTDLDEKLNPITPTKPTNTEDHTESPWTPTANLKMLISAASPEIRNRERQKNMNKCFREIPAKNNLEMSQVNGKVKTGKRNSIKTSKELNTCEQTAVDMEIDNHFETDDKTAQGSRKEKSLGLLCHRFLSRFSEFPDNKEKIEICLDEVAKELCVERRRIYDIINVLESVEIVSRLAKNKYLWHGKSNLKHTLAKLKALAKLEGFAKQVEMIKEFETNRDFKGLVDEQNSRETMSLNDSTCTDELESKAKACKASCKNFLRVYHPLEADCKRDNQKKDKSLGIMSQRFIMLFLLSKPKTVNLDLSAKILIGDPNIDRTENAKFKTKIRRLYDIANILTSLGLIKKVHVTECRGRKPAFTYTGPEIDDVDSFSTCSQDAAHRPSSRHSLLNCIQNPHVCSMLSVPKSFTPEAFSDHSPCSAESSDSVAIPPQLARKSFTRHSSFEQICEVAELERNRLYFESTRSQPVSPTTDGTKESFAQAKSIVKASAVKCLLVSKDENSDKTISNMSGKEVKPRGKSGKMVILKAVDSNCSSQAFTMSENQFRGLLRNVKSNVSTTVGASYKGVPTQADSNLSKPSISVNSTADQKKNGIFPAARPKGYVKISYLKQSGLTKQANPTTHRQPISIKHLLEGSELEEPAKKRLNLATTEHSFGRTALPAKTAACLQSSLVTSCPTNPAASCVNSQAMNARERAEINPKTKPVMVQGKSLTEESVGDEKPFPNSIHSDNLHQGTVDVLPAASQSSEVVMGAMSVPKQTYNLSNMSSPIMFLSDHLGCRESSGQVPDTKSFTLSPQHVASNPDGHSFIAGLGQLVSPVMSVTSSSFSADSLKCSPLASNTSLVTKSSQQILLPNSVSGAANVFQTPALPGSALGSKGSNSLSSNNVINLVPLVREHLQQILPLPASVTSAFVISPHEKISQPQIVHLTTTKSSDHSPATQPDTVFLTPNARILVNGKPICTPGCFFHSTPSSLQQVPTSAVITGLNSVLQAVTSQRNEIALSAARKLHLSQEDYS